MGKHTARERLLQGTRADIVRQLRRGPLSVNELASALGITDNAVRAQLARLGADGLAAPSGQRPSSRRPEQLYALTPEAEDLFPKAYDALLGELLDVLERRVEEDEVAGALKEVGERMGAQFRASPGRTHEEQVQRAVQLVEDLGGAAELAESDGRLMIKGLSCPVAAVAKGRPAVCQMVAILLSEATDLRVRATCDNTHDHARCAFAVE